MVMVRGPLAVKRKRGARSTSTQIRADLATNNPHVQERRGRDRCTRKRSSRSLALPPRKAWAPPCPADHAHTAVLSMRTAQLTHDDVIAPPVSGFVLCSLLTAHCSACREKKNKNLGLALATATCVSSPPHPTFPSDAMRPAFDPVSFGQCVAGAGGPPVWV